MGLRSKLIEALLSSNRKISAASSREEILDFIKILRPSQTGFELVRIGGEGDGGYLVPNDFEGIGFCFSPGVSEIATFEEQLANDYSIKSFMADASVENPPIKGDFFDFEKKFLGTQNSGEYMRLETWVADKDVEIRDADLILQMDIEGAEYDVLIDTSSDILKRFRIIVIEFHSLDMIFDRAALRFLRAIMEKITNYFAIAHIHPNNYKSPVCNQGVEVPKALEITFFRKDRIKKSQDSMLIFPHPLDHPNLPNSPDVILPKIWWSDYNSI